MVTFPAPVLVKVTAALETIASLAFNVVMVKVWGEVPSSESVVPLTESVILDPTICTGSCVETAPAVAVTVAVRLIDPPPAEKVNVAVPVESVTTVAAPRIPVSALMVTVTSEIAAFAALSAVTVTVVADEPSDVTVVGEAERARDAAVAEGVVVSVSDGGVVVLAGDPPPHPASAAIVAASNSDAKNLVISLLKKEFHT